MTDKIAIGIDLGTSTSCVGVMWQGHPRLIPNEAGAVIHSSVVSFLEDGSVLVGNPAKQRLVTNPETTVASAKRLIGRYYFAEEVEKAKRSAAYNIVEGLDYSVHIELGARRYSIPEISALILREMKRIACVALKREVNDAVITVPAYFNDKQRQDTRDAGRIAGLNVLRIINEPTAAALAYGFGRKLHQKVAVYDLGGGTFDISILEIGDDVFEVLGTAGDTFLGGDDFDARVLGFLAELFQRNHSFDPLEFRTSYAALRALAEWGKQQLATAQSVEMRMPAVYADAKGKTYGIAATLDQAAFRELTFDLIQRTFQVCDEALRSAGLQTSDLDGVILVGGPTPPFQWF